jgi:membrane fusion protein (multidrug efflux system)
MGAPRLQPAVRAVRLTITTLVVLIAAVLAYVYWDYQRHNPTTDDAYVQANIVGIAAQVGGPILHTHIVDNQRVKIGDPLFEIDPRPFELAVEEARARRDQTRQDVDAADAAVRAAQAEVTNRAALLLYARQYVDRIKPLARKNYLSQDRLEEAVTQLHAAEAQLSQAQHNLVVAQRTLGDPGATNAKLRSAEAALATAELNLTYTHLYAPRNGLITNLNLPVGTYVHAGQELFAVIDTDSWWFSANYKETALARVRPGQPAEITLNAYPGYRFRGVVHGIGWGIHQSDGATQRLLPQVDPVVYWVRLAQRFPVRIDFVEPDPTHPLRVGASGSVTIHTDADASAR